MRTMMTVLVTAVLIAALVLATGCEATPLTAGDGYTLTLTANPSTVTIPTGGTTPATSQLRAQVLSDTGTPQDGFTVYFSTTGGALSATTVDTNSSGEAFVTLTVAASDAAEITVTATSSTLSATVKVTKSTGAANRAPVATIVALPAVEQAILRSVSFDGSTSTDPDSGDSVASYSWTISSSAPDSGWTNPQTFTTSSIQFPAGFTHAQTLTANLQVTDQHGLASALSSYSYAIKDALCSDNAAPTAKIVGFGNPAPAAVGSHVIVTADGTTSIDPPNNVITSWVWSCGNGTSGGTTSHASCDYVVAATKKTYTISLVVTDDGLGGAGPTYTCQKTSTAATLSVDIDVLP